MGRRPILTLAIGWSATRILLLAQLAAFSDAWIGDVRLYALWSILLREGQFPVGDPFWQYPPGAGVLFAGLGSLGASPVWAFLVLALLADAAILAMLCGSVARGPAAFRSWWGPTAWVVGGLAIGPVMIARFDLIPTAVAVAAILLLNRPAASGAMAGLGALLKVWPILVLIALPRRRVFAGCASAVAVVLLAVTAIGAWAPGSTSFLAEQRSRGLQIESLGALPYLIAGAMGSRPEVVLRFGAFEVQAPWVNQLGLALTGLGILLIAGLAALRVLGRLESAPGGDIALLAIMISVATSRVLSPQYAVWLIGIAAAAGCAARSRGRQATWLLIAMAAVTQVLFPWGYGSYLEAAGYAVGLQTVRIGLLLGAIGVIAAATLRPAFAPRATNVSAGPSPGLRHEA